MTAENILPLVPAFLFVLWALLHSIFADSRTKSRIQGVFGDWTTRWYRLIYVLLSTASLAGIMWLSGVWPGPDVWEIAGFPRMILLAIKAAALLALIAASTRMNAGDFLGYGRLKGQTGESKLDIGGPYRLVRHPLYTLGFPAIWAAPHMSLGSLLLSIAASLYLWLGTYHEERGLREEFGEDYVNYAQRVPRLIPRFRKKSGVSPESSRGITADQDTPVDR